MGMCSTRRPRSLVVLIAAAVLTGGMTISTEEGPKAPSISKVASGMSTKQVETAMGPSTGRFSTFGHDCRIYLATTVDGKQEKPHFVLFRDDQVVAWGEGGSQTDCLGPIKGREQSGAVIRKG